MTVSVKLINKTARLQTLLLSGGQPLPIPPNDTGVTVTFDASRDDDRKQMERLRKTLTQPAVRRQGERGELVVEGFDKLEAALAPAPAQPPKESKAGPKNEQPKNEQPPAQPPQNPPKP